MPGAILVYVVFCSTFLEFTGVFAEDAVDSFDLVYLPFPFQPGDPRMETLIQDLRTDANSALRDGTQEAGELLAKLGIVLRLVC